MIPAVVLAAALAGGCIARRDAGGELDRAWYLDENPWPRSSRKPVALGRRRVPTRWTFRREPSMIRSTADIARAVDTLKAGADEIEIPVSGAHARMIESILADARAAMQRLEDIADPDHPPSPDVWARAVADALIQGEIVARAATRHPAAASRPTPPEADGQSALSAEPVLEMAIAYLNERAGGRLLAGIDARGVNRLREIIAQVILRLGFAVAGRDPPEALRAEAARQLSEAPDPRRLREALAGRLRQELEAASPALGDQQLRSLLRMVVATAPPALEIVESLVRQWPRIDSVQMELRQVDGQPLLGVTVDVAPGRSVRLAKVHPAQPAIVFRGRSRIIVIPRTPGTGETAILFEPGPAGATELRFEGIPYALVRLLALPLADGTLREVRLLSTDPLRGRQVTTVAMLMEAKGRGDPRRLFVLHDVRNVDLLRTPFDVRTVQRSRDLTVSYVTPRYRYTYVYQKGGM